MLKVWDREKIVVIPDHYIFTNDERAHRNVDIARDFCVEQDIKYFYDIQDRSNFRVRCLFRLFLHIGWFHFLFYFIFCIWSCFRFIFEVYYKGDNLDIC